MMEKGYKATGWLGLILGSRLYFNFDPESVQTDEAFMNQVKGCLHNRTDQFQLRCLFNSASILILSTSD